MLQLIPNAKEVATRASSMYALYGAFVIDVTIKVLEYIQTHRDLKWQDAAVPIALIIIGACRLVQQQALASATDRRLQQERIAREELEQIATSAGPPITHDQVRAIKRDAAAKAGKK